MGFLRVNTETVPLGDDYWAKVRELSTDEYAPIEDILAQVGVAGEGMTAEVHMAVYRRALVTAALVDWNLTDEDDQPLPVDGHSVGRLPISAFEALHKAVSALNGPRRGREVAQFRDAGAVGAQDGHAGSAGAAAVPVGAGAVEAAG